MNQYHRLRFPREPHPIEATQPGSRPPAEPLTLEAIGSTGIMSIYSVHSEELDAEDGRVGMYAVASCR